MEFEEFSQSIENGDITTPDEEIEVTPEVVKESIEETEADAYKPLKSGGPGGLGGVGIENWILQHGGSLYDAAQDFLEVADSCSSFDEFKEKYYIYDLGENHYIAKAELNNGHDTFRNNSLYPHENFVGDYGKMSEEGYERMKNALREYVDSLQTENEDRIDVNEDHHIVTDTLFD